MFCLLSRRSGPVLRPLANLLPPLRLGTASTSASDPQLLTFAQLWKPTLFACGVRITRLFHVTMTSYLTPVSSLQESLLALLPYVLLKGTGAGIAV